MRDYDTIIRQASVVTEEGVSVCDVGISGESFTAIESAISESAETEINASGKFMFPGLVDAHVHFNEPGRGDWEGFATGSTALAAGGGTCFIDMPLNSAPPLLDIEAFEAKRKAGERNSRLDFALWAGLTPESLPHLSDLAKCGVAGFKAFLCPSGLAEFQPADEETLREGMKAAAEWDLPVAVHAESPEALAAHWEKFPPPSPGSMRDWLESRPVCAELAAIEMALACAMDTGCALHIVHVSSPQGIELVTTAKREGIDVTAETCPHYLLLNAEDACRIGPAAKCAPPLRPAEVVDGLWKMLAAGEVDTIGSDHSPSPPELKQGDDFFAMWGGIAGAQHGFPLLIERAHRELSWERLARLVSTNPARRFGLSEKKGRIAVGLDADFCLLAADKFLIDREDLLARHPISPYVGMSSKWRVSSTWLRGNPVSPATTGRFLSRIHD